MAASSASFRRAGSRGSRTAAPRGRTPAPARSETGLAAATKPVRHRDRAAAAPSMLLARASGVVLFPTVDPAVAFGSRVPALSSAESEAARSLVHTPPRPANFAEYRRVTCATRPQRHDLLRAR